jgi:hypothetical protein
MAKFKHYTPPTKLPATIRKGMTMDKFPLWAWPVFSRTVELQERGGGLHLEDEIAMVTSEKRRRIVKKANQFIKDRLTHLLDTREYGGSDAEYAAFKAGIPNSVLAAVLNAAQPRNFDDDGIATQLPVVESAKRREGVTFIQWEDGYTIVSGEGFTYLQKITGRKSFVFIIDGEDTRADDILPFVVSPTGGIPFDEKGRAYIDFDKGGHVYQATVRSIDQLRDFLSRGENVEDIKSAKVARVFKQESEFTSADLETVIRSFGIEVK